MDLEQFTHLMPCSIVINKPVEDGLAYQAVAVRRPRAIPV